MRVVAENRHRRRARACVVALQYQHRVVYHFKVGLPAFRQRYLRALHRAQTAADDKRAHRDARRRCRRRRIDGVVSKTNVDIRRVNKGDRHRRRRRLRVAVNKRQIINNKFNFNIRRIDREEVVVADSVAGITQRAVKAVERIVKIIARRAVCITGAGRRAAACQHLPRQSRARRGETPLPVLRRHRQRRAWQIVNHQRRNKLNRHCLVVVLRGVVGGVKSVNCHRHRACDIGADDNFIIDNNRRAGTPARNRRRHIAAR